MTKKALLWGVLFVSFVIIIVYSQLQEIEREPLPATPTAEQVEAVATAAVSPTAAAPTEPAVVPPEPGLQNVLFISEVLAGAHGGDAGEFVELYNPTLAAVDLKGWSLWYQAAAGEALQPLYRWESRTDVPALGYYLLVRADTDVGATADATFGGPLPAEGGLILLNAEREAVSVVGWGDAPAGVFAGSPAAMPEDGRSLNRRPSEATARDNEQDTGDNGADFALADAPTPQNSGNATQGERPPLSMRLEVPLLVQPGEEFVVTIRAANNSYVGNRPVSVVMHVPEALRAPGLEEVMVERRLIGGQRMAPGTALPIDLTLIAPATAQTIVFNGAYVEVEGQRAYAPIQRLVVAEPAAADQTEGAAKALVLEMAGPATAAPGQTLVYTLTAVNATEQPLSDVQIAGGGFVEVDGEPRPVDKHLDGGREEGVNYVWEVGELAPGGRVAVRFVYTIRPGDGEVVVGAAAARVGGRPGVVWSEGVVTVVGGSP